MRGDERLQPWLLVPVAILALQMLAFPAPGGAMFQGAVLGLITALSAVGIVLVYQASRVLNFAQAELGLLPATLAVMLVVESGWPWLAGFALGIPMALVLGAAAEFMVIRRFTASPRLVLTVATLGLAQVLAFASLLVPRWWDARVTSQRISAPFADTFSIGSFQFNQNHVWILLVVPVALGGIAILLRATPLGIAIRASADDGDRAALLGIPVRHVRTLVWALAALLGFLAIYLRSGVIGLPVRGDLGLLFFLRSLAAAMIGRLSNIGTAVAAAVALDVLQQGVAWNQSSPDAAEAIMAALTAAIILVTLLAGGRSFARSDTRTETLAMGDIRALAGAVRQLRLVRWSALALGAAVLVGAWFVPTWFGTGGTLRMAALYLFTIIVASLVVLTGWAGQISLGQGALALLGGTVGAWLTLEWELDIILVTLLSGLVGAAVAAVVGLPALRLRGLYLAVTTLATALALSSYLLNPRFFDWIPDDRVPRRPIFGRIDWDSTRGVYFVCLVAMLVTLVGLQGIRRSRTGRVLLALRDNEAGVTAYGVSVMRAKLTAFAIAGFMCGCSGALFVHHQQSLVGPTGGAGIGLLIAAVVGGLGSLLGAFLGALWFWGTFWWLEGNWRVFATGFGAIAVLLVAPGGLAMLVYQARDALLQRILGRRS